ncbi:MAG: hypothetical protein M3323_14185, partial [Actinomycetota bacterium]|nr:hypothetical protein [Actinomycetota bacterium]
MSTRVCPRCGAEVAADADRCPRGHSLSQGVGGELQDLRAEVDQAFELARKKVATALSEIGGPAEESLVEQALRPAAVTEPKPQPKAVAKASTKASASPPKTRERPVATRTAATEATPSRETRGGGVKPAAARPAQATAA